MLELLSDYNRDAYALFTALKHYPKVLHPDICNASALKPAVFELVIERPFFTIPLVERRYLQVELPDD